MDTSFITCSIYKTGGVNPRQSMNPNLSVSPHINALRATDSRKYYESFPLNNQLLF
jgi:hypothetical protein